MKKITIIKVAFSLIVLFITGCYTFFEEDISDKTVKLVSPAQGIETEVVSQIFLWEMVEGASSYRLQIVSPSIDSSEVLVMDTLVTDNKFSTILFPSSFEWRVRAENSVWQSQWSIGKFLIFSSTDLTRQKVNLLSPGLITNSLNLFFQWSELTAADNYSFVVYNIHWDGTLAITPTELSTTSMQIQLYDGQYVWGVRARNSTSETLYSQKSLIVDSTPPEKPVLSSPADSSELTNTTVLFTWNSSDQTSGIAQDTLKVYSDTGLKNVIKTIVSESNTAEISFTEREKYYWTIRSVDRAGNAGNTSGAYIFTIK